MDNKPQNPFLDFCQSEMGKIVAETFDRYLQEYYLPQIASPAPPPNEYHITEIKGLNTPTGPVDPLPPGSKAVLDAVIDLGIDEQEDPSYVGRDQVDLPPTVTPEQSQDPVFITSCDGCQHHDCATCPDIQPIKSKLLAKLKARGKTYQIMDAWRKTKGDKTEEAPVADHQDWALYTGDVKAQITKFTKHLQSAVQVAASLGREREMRRGKIDPGRVWKAGTRQSMDVFQQPGDIIAPHLAVSVLLDSTGSMNGDKARACRQMGLVQGFALNAVNTPFQVIGFAGTSPLHLTYFKRFRQNWKSRSTAIDAYEVGGGTNIGDPIFIAMDESLKLYPQHHHLIIVASDGEPSGEDGKINLRSALSLCEEFGVSTFGMGIKSRHVMHYFKDWIVVDSLTNMTDEFFKNFEKYVVKVVAEQKVQHHGTMN